MDTVKVGDKFENEAYGLISNAIEKELFGISKKYARLFKKKKYYSKERESDIIFDLAIEIWPPSANSFRFYISLNVNRTLLSQFQ